MFSEFLFPFSGYLRFTVVSAYSRDNLPFTLRSSLYLKEVILTPSSSTVMSTFHTTFGAFPSRAYRPPVYGAAPVDLITKLASMVNAAKLPVLLLGMRASDPTTVGIIHNLLTKHPIPVLETFQAAGCISRDLEHLFFGRLGLFRNQPGDKLLAKSDLVLTVGYDPTE